MGTVPTSITDRSFHLSQQALELIKTAEKFEKYSSFDFECEGAEPLFKYYLPDGRVLLERIVGAFHFLIALVDAATGNVIEESLA